MRRLSLALLGFAVSLAAVPPLPAWAQPDPTWDGRQAAGLTRPEFEGFSRILGTTPELDETALALIEGTRHEIAALKRRADEAEQAFNALPEERKTSESREPVAEARLAAVKGMRALRTRLLNDLRMILTPEQDQHWPAFERFLRRERYISSQGARGLESVNLIAVAEEAALGEASSERISPILDKYDRELDAILREIERMEREVEEINATGIGTRLELIDRLDVLNQGMVDELVKLRRFNLAMAGLMTKVAAPDEAERLRVAFERIALPRPVGSQRMDLVFAKAAELEGLDEAKRAELARLGAEFARRQEALWPKFRALQMKAELGGDEAAKAYDEWQRVGEEVQALASEARKKLMEHMSREQYIGVLVSIDDQGGEGPSRSR